MEARHLPKMDSGSSTAAFLVATSGTQVRMLSRRGRRERPSERLTRAEGQRVRETARCRRLLAVAVPRRFFDSDTHSCARSWKVVCKSAPVHQSFDPTFNERFRFRDSAGRTLKLTLYNFSLQTEGDLIGKDLVKGEDEAGKHQLFSWWQGGRIGLCLCWSRILLHWSLACGFLQTPISASPPGRPACVRISHSVSNKARSLVRASHSVLKSTPENR